MRNTMRAVIAWIILWGSAPPLAEAQLLVKQSTATTVNFKLTKIADGTDETGATIGSVTASLAKQSTTSSSSSTSITCAASATTHDCVHIAKGLYNMELTSGDTDTLGRLDVCVAYSGAYTDCTRYEVVADASYAVNVDGDLSDTTTLQADIDDIQARLPAALTGNGNMKSDALRVNGTAQTAADIGSLATTVNNKLGAPAVTVSNDIAALQTALPNAVPGGAGGLPLVDASNRITGMISLPKNVAFNNFMLKMRRAGVSPATGVTGATVSCTRSLDGAAFGACNVGTATEVGSGWYKINLAASDLNGNIVVLKFDASGGSGTADSYEQVILTQR